MITGKATRVVFVLVFLVCCFGFLGQFVQLGFLFSKMWYPGISKKATAEILVSGDKFSGRALGKAKWHGEQIVFEIGELTDQFTKINNKNGRLVTTFLDSISMSQTEKYAKDLYQGGDKVAKLFGQFMLVKMGAYDHSVGDLNLSQYIRLEKNSPTSDIYVAPGFEFYPAILTAGYIGGEENIALIEDVLNRPASYQVHNISVEALSKIPSQRAIQILRSKLTSVEFYAVKPAYLALVRMGDTKAVELLQERKELANENSAYETDDLLDPEILRVLQIRN